MHPVRVGTCGWSYKEWSGVFYPKGLAAGNQLSYLAQHFPVVEVDSTFYHSPARRMVEGWRDRTPAGFGFSLKVPQTITHEKVLLDCREEVDAFLAAARLLGDKLLGCCLQFGYFNQGKIATLGAFLDRLDPFLAAWPPDVSLAVEVRNKAWMTAALADCLRRYNAVWVLPDQVWMPSPLSMVERLDAVTGPFAYVRRLGDREAVDALTPRLDHVVIDRGGQVAADAQAIRLLRQAPEGAASSETAARARAGW
jgi:uncharacterized protein YecE (DUF72 family)